MSHHAHLSSKAATRVWYLEQRSLVAALRRKDRIAALHLVRDPVRSGHRAKKCDPFHSSKGGERATVIRYSMILIQKIKEEMF